MRTLPASSLLHTSGPGGDWRRTRPSRARRRRGLQRIAALLAVLVVAAGAVSTVFLATATTPAPAVPVPHTGFRTRLLTLAERSAHHRHRAPSAEDRSIDRVLRRMPFITGGGGRVREIALTFDDGPGPYTRQVLRVLRAGHAPATFFVVGQMIRDFRGSLDAEDREGFAVGDHTENHPFLARLARSAQVTQIADAASGLRLQGLHYPRLFRPPYRSFSPVTLSALKGFRMLMVLWSVDSRDYTRPGVRAIVRRVVGGARPGAIVLMHDAGGERSQTVQALPLIVRALRKRHFSLVTVPRLLRDDPPARTQRLPTAAGG